MAKTTTYVITSFQHALSLVAEKITWNEVPTVWIKLLGWLKSLCNERICRLEQSWEKNYVNYVKFLWNERANYLMKINPNLQCEVKLSVKWIWRNESQSQYLMSANFVPQISSSYVACEWDETKDSKLLCPVKLSVKRRNYTKPLKQIYKYWNEPEKLHLLDPWEKITGYR